MQLPQVPSTYALWPQAGTTLRGPQYPNIWYMYMYIQVPCYVATTLVAAHVTMAVVDADTHSNHVANKRLEQDEEKKELRTVVVQEGTYVRTRTRVATKLVLLGKR